MNFGQYAFMIRRKTTVLYIMKALKDKMFLFFTQFCYCKINPSVKAVFTIIAEFKPQHSLQVKTYSKLLHAL